MNESEWVRLPVEISADTDRRDLCAIMCANGLEVRIVKVRETNRGTPKRYIEYRVSKGFFTPHDGKNLGSSAS